MGTRYVCNNEKRRQILRDSALSLNGIDYLEVLDNDAPPGTAPQETLLVRMLKPAPWGLSENNVRIDGGVRVKSVKAEWVLRASEASDALVAAGQITLAEKDFFLALPDADQILVVRANTDGDFSVYTLRLLLSPTSEKPPTDFDPILSQVDFSFKVECPTEFDCEVEEVCPPELADEPVIDYLARDFASFRKLMLDRLSVVLPDWQERNPADVGIALVEVMAYAADYLSYFQDGVATEAYLDTARRRTSIRRHARLLDYPMHDGSNARTWVHFQVGANATLGRGTQLLTRISGQGATIAPNSSALDQAMNQQPVVFETIHRATLTPENNRLNFYTWGDEECCLPTGATQATLSGHFPDLKPGDVLIFVEEWGVETGKRADANLAHRHAVRLTGVTPGEDPLGGQMANPPNANPVPVTNIGWMAEDALPFPLCLHMVEIAPEDLQPGDPAKQPVSVALGNIVLADYGRTISGETIPSPASHRRYRPRLNESNITYRTGYDHDEARNKAATVIVQQDPRKALPAVELGGNGTQWITQRDLLASGRFATEFVVEAENDGRAYLRFGDGIFGRKPLLSEKLTASYRIGNGTAGNIGANALAHVVTGEGVTGVTNPLAALGGTDPESLEEVRQYAPQAFRTQERAVTEEDYAAVAERHPQVQKAKATRRWTGSWHTMFLTVDRMGGLPVDPAFEDDLRLFLERFRLAGQDLEIDGPRFVPLELAFVVCVEPNYFRSDVKEALLEVFSNRDLPDGRRGFFHPDNFTFGQPVYLSQIVAAAMQVTGVRWIDTSDQSPNLFKRWGESAHGEFDKGQIDLGRLEIARLDNDPSQRENGKIELIMQGGL